MNVFFQCTNKISDFTSDEKGLYCSDCKKHILDTRIKNSPAPKPGDCIITDKPQKKYESINFQKRLLLAVVIVMASTIFSNLDARADRMIQKLEVTKNIMLSDSVYYFRGSVSDMNGKPISPVRVEVWIDGKLTNTEVDYHYEYRGASYFLELSRSDLKKSVSIKIFYYDQMKSIDITESEDYDDFPVVQFERNKKDKFNKKRFPKIRHVVGGSPF